ncbi:MAG: outer membrane protein transport protein [Kofleriaceae bacterium]|nr:outer membrane protein transport protein [Kofleriaceae bacterium]
MKLRVSGWLGSGLFVAVTATPTAHAGGMTLPGPGAIATARAGAAVASADDGEALAINPAGLAKSKGTTITISMALINYMLEFQRAGTYDEIPEEALPYEGQPYPLVKNDPDLPLGIGKYQPVPVVAIVTDLGGIDPKLRLAAGLYAPNAYPFRDFCSVQGNGACRKYTFNGDFNEPPAPGRYDVVKQDAAVLLPSIAASYRILPQLDVGARFSAGFANIKSTVGLWGIPGNVNEYVKQDAYFSAEATDSFVPAWGVGLTYRPTPTIEVAAAYNSQISITARGDAHAETGPAVSLSGVPFVIGPAGQPRCEAGGTFEKQKACVELALPMTATVGGRYKFLGKNGEMRGDIELNVGWENWGAERATDYRVVVDGAVYTERNGVLEENLGLKDTLLRHGFQNTYSARLGGSYVAPVGTNSLTIRGGVGYDTAAAKKGWYRIDIDGAARTTATIGAGFRTKRWELNLGGGAILEGSNTNEGVCNPPNSTTMAGCNADGNERPVEDREGPDPLNPLVSDTQQIESPVNKGTIKSNYVLFMLGFTTWF